MAKENDIRTVWLRVCTIDIRGDVTTKSEDHLKGAYEKAQKGGASKILMKFDQDAYINSGGIAVLMQILAETVKNKQKIGMVGLSPHYKKIFGMVGITKFAKIFDTIEDTLEDMFDEV